MVGRVARRVRRANPGRSAEKDRPGTPLLPDANYRYQDDRVGEGNHFSSCPLRAYAQQRSAEQQPEHRRHEGPKHLARRRGRSPCRGTAGPRAAPAPPRARARTAGRSRSASPCSATSSSISTESSRTVALTAGLRHDVAARVDQHQSRPRRRRRRRPRWRGRRRRAPGGARRAGARRRRPPRAVPRAGTGGVARRARPARHRGAARARRAVENAREAVDAARGPEVQQHDPAAQLARSTSRPPSQPAPPAQRRRPYPRSCPHVRTTPRPVTAFRSGSPERVRTPRTMEQKTHRVTAAPLLGANHRNGVTSSFAGSRIRLFCPVRPVRPCSVQRVDRVERRRKGFRHDHEHRRSGLPGRRPRIGVDGRELGSVDDEIYSRNASAGRSEWRCAGASPARASPWVPLRRADYIDEVSRPVRQGRAAARAPPRHGPRPVGRGTRPTFTATTGSTTPTSRRRRSSSGSTPRTRRRPTRQAASAAGHDAGLQERRSL